VTGELTEVGDEAGEGDGDEASGIGEDVEWVVLIAAFQLV
jgi:hypothetical protein